MKAPGLAGWVAALATLCTIGVAQFLGRGDNGFLRVAGVVFLALAAALIFTPFFLLRKHGRIEEGGTYVQTTAVVDQGAYAIVRHPQYLGYMLLAWGFALLSQHWTAVALAVVSSVGFSWQAMEEERTDLARFGEAYRLYAQRVPRFNLILGILRMAATAVREA